ncbi:hypothetical protein HK102_007148, partial [Quaeritorhiza haematococci]
MTDRRRSIGALIGSSEDDEYAERQRNHLHQHNQKHFQHNERPAHHQFPHFQHNHKHQHQQQQRQGHIPQLEDGFIPEPCAPYNDGEIRRDRKGKERDNGNGSGSGSGSSSDDTGSSNGGNGSSGSSGSNTNGGNKSSDSNATSSSRDGGNISSNGNGNSSSGSSSSQSLRSGATRIRSPSYASVVKSNISSEPSSTAHPHHHKHHSFHRHPHHRLESPGASSRGVEVDTLSNSSRTSKTSTANNNAHYHHHRVWEQSPSSSTKPYTPYTTTSTGHQWVSTFPAPTASTSQTIPTTDFVVASLFTPEAMDVRPDGDDVCLPVPTSVAPPSVPLVPPDPPDENILLVDDDQDIQIIDGVEEEGVDMDSGDTTKSEGPTYQLVIVQQPNRARMMGFGERD